MWYFPQLLCKILICLHKFRQTNFFTVNWFHEKFSKLSHYTAIVLSVCRRIFSWFFQAVKCKRCDRFYHLYCVYKLAGTSGTARCIGHKCKAILDKKLNGSKVPEEEIVEEPNSPDQTPSPSTSKKKSSTIKGKRQLVESDSD